MDNDYNIMELVDYIDSVRMCYPEDFWNYAYEAKCFESNHIEKKWMSKCYEKGIVPEIASKWLIRAYTLYIDRSYEPNRFSDQKDQEA